MPVRKKTKVTTPKNTEPQHCQCFIRADGSDPERLAMYQRVFWPDGRVPIIQNVGEVAGQTSYMVDFSRLKADQKADFIKEMASKLKITEEVMAREVETIGVAIKAEGVALELCANHDHAKSESATAEAAAPEKGGESLPEKTKTEPDQPKVYTPRVLKTEKRSLPHKLTEEEYHERSRDLSLTFSEIIQELARQKRVREELKGSMSALVSKQSSLAQAVRTGEEPAMVDVDITIAGDNAVVQEIRKDTGQVIATRPATDYERQGAMFQESDLFHEKG